MESYNLRAYIPLSFACIRISIIRYNGRYNLRAFLFSDSVSSDY